MANDGLNVAEVLLLKDGDEIEVTWGGGNGPHCYLVKWWADRPWAVTRRRPDDLVGDLAAPGDLKCIHKIRQCAQT